MYTVTGSFKDGVAMPDEPVHGLDGRQVLITFLDNVDDVDDVDDFSSLEEVVESIRALGPNERNYTPPTSRLSDVITETTEIDPIASAEWDRQWAEIEAEMKRRDLNDDRAEGRI